MTSPADIAHLSPEDATLTESAGTVILFVESERRMTGALADADAATGGAVSRAMESGDFGKKAGATRVLGWPSGLKAERLALVALGDGEADALKAGGAAAAQIAGEEATLYAPDDPDTAADIALGAALRLYRFETYKTDAATEAADRKAPPKRLRLVCAAPEAAAARGRDRAALADAVFFARDLVNEPANVLTTEDFAARLAGMQEIGLEVDILEEPELERLGLRCLLAVGRGSESPSRLVTMRWSGGGDEAPLALVGKGVVFDTGGISIKPSGGMEEMTMDMGGAATVAGVMRALALRRAKANVIGVVGLVENMPDGRAQRPGDIIRSMKGDTVEVINTDAEGRLVLADALWYAQETFAPRAVIDFATLTGAIIVALGKGRAGLFSNDDALAGQIAAAAEATGEAAWRMPLGAEYDRMLKSRLADMRNSTGREASAITAAQFLKRFVKEGAPWAHLDIAGVALRKDAAPLCPAGATGWGVRLIDRLVRENFEA